ncbi:MAG: ROK family transcriptional regulator [Sphingomonadales bacterium]
MGKDVIRDRNRRLKNSPETDSPLTNSQRRILDLVFRKGALTQADITVTADLTQQSVSRIISGLTDCAMLKSGKRVSSGKRGYPSATVEINPGFTHAFGISVMTDAVSVALIDFSGTVLHEQKRGFTAMPLDAVVDWIAATLDTIRADHMPDNSRIAGAGVGIPGSFIGNDIGFNTSHMLEDWAHIDLEAILSERLGLEVWTDNDGNVAALGESMVGVGRWASSFAYLHLATGVGGGIVLNNDLWRGRYGNAGEFAGGLPPNIYPFPNLELLRHLVSQDGLLFSNVNEMVAAFDPAWPAIDNWINKVRDSLSIIASNVTAILDLDAIVLGGRMPRLLAERVIPQIELYDQKRRSIARPTARLVPAEAQGDAAAIGAALLPLKHKYFTAPEN